jgi:hypothetical protein
MVIIEGDSVKGQREALELILKKIESQVKKGPSTLAFFASVSPSAMAPLPNCFLCFSRTIMYVFALRKQLGGGAIADSETDAKNASVDGP